MKKSNTAKGAVLDRAHGDPSLKGRAMRRIGGDVIPGDALADQPVRDQEERGTRPKQLSGLGTLLAEMGRKVGGVDLHIEREPMQGEPIRFE
ncbi:hypothetical protein [Burkholderia sp. Bp8963]|uniref:hypothetical protein n=1 Tax=Burkholderia sp. Bp8963 TaxID=2184547 RepID=UPI000F5AF35F|nr:hypothetical protein [Burkholderia sp. Bp8963]